MLISHAVTHHDHNRSHHTNTVTPPDAWYLCDLLPHYHTHDMVSNMKKIMASSLHLGSEQESLTEARRPQWTQASPYQCQANGCVPSPRIPKPCTYQPHLAIASLQATEGLLHEMGVESTQPSWSGPKHTEAVFAEKNEIQE